jgi:sugar phosphate isomerase/epimerase
VRISVFPKGDIRAIVEARTMTVFDWINKARVLRIEGLELFSGMFWETDDASVDRVGEALAAADFEMPMLCASPDFTNPDVHVRRRDIERQKRLIEITARIGGAGASCRVLSGQRHPEVSVEQGLEWAAAAILDVLPVAKSLDVTLALENHYKDGTWLYPEFAQRKEVFLELLDRIDDRVHFGVQFDPSNALVAGEDPAEFLEVVIDRVVTMQASDRYLKPGVDIQTLRQSDGTLGYSPDLQHGVIGKGLIDYPCIFRSLVAAGYDGWISVEDGVQGMWEMEESVEFLRAARDEYFGGSMTAGVASRRAAREAAGLPPLSGDQAVAEDRATR